jgi:chromosome segregation ATPase
MENTRKISKKAIIGIFAGTIALASVYGIVNHNKAAELSETNMSISKKTDSLMIIKEKLEFEIDDLAKELEAEVSINKNLAITVEKINTQLSEKEQKLNRLKGQIDNANKANLSSQEQIALLSTQIKELTTLRETMEQNLISIQDEFTALTNENKALKTQTEELASRNKALESDIENLNKDMDVLKFESPADNFRIELLKPNTKLTAKAKKVRTLKVTFQIPQRLRRNKTEKEMLYLTILDVNKNPVKGVQKELKIKDSDKIAPIAVHAMKEVTFSGNNSNVVSFMFDLQEKLSAGTYSVSVYSDSDYLGTTEFSVKKSFLFF